MEELMQRTSVEAAASRREVSLADQDLFSHPFLYMTGRYDFEPFTPDEIETLRRFLSYGGFLLADDALGQPGYGFDRSLRREIKRIFPDKEFRRLPIWKESRWAMRLRSSTVRTISAAPGSETSSATGSTRAPPGGKSSAETPSTSASISSSTP